MWTETRTASVRIAEISDMKIVGAKKMTRAQVRKYVKERVDKGAATAGAFIVKMLKVEVGVQAPRARSKSATCGWVATTKADAGAPPRRVSGCGQSSIYWRRVKQGLAFGAKRFYMMILEHKNHPWLYQTVERYIKEAGRIAGYGSKK